MEGAERRTIKAVGRVYTIRAAAGGSGGRETPNYSVTGEVPAVVEQLDQPQTVVDTDGTTVESDVELRAVLPSGSTVLDADASGFWPVKLDAPGGDPTYRVIDSSLEDGGVAVLTVVED